MSLDSGFAPPRARNDVPALPAMTISLYVAAGMDTRAKTNAVSLSGVDVTFRLAGGGSYRAVTGATLTVADGEFVSIVGPTGCGKSTLLNIVAGLLAPAAGTVDIFGSSLAALNRQAGYLFQADALFPWKTALENVAIGLETAGTPTVRRASARRPGSRASGLARSATATRTCCRVASASASASRRCSSAIRRYC